MAANNGKKVALNFFKQMIEGRGFERVIDKVRIISVGEGKCDAEMTVGKEHQNRSGTLHGGMTAALVDCISTLALLTQGKGVTGVSVNMNMTYLKAAKDGEEILINAKTLKGGRNLVYLDVQITNKLTGDIIATGLHTVFMGHS